MALAAAFPFPQSRFWPMKKRHACLSRENDVHLSSYAVSCVIRTNLTECFLLRIPHTGLIMNILNPSTMQKSVSCAAMLG